MVRYSRFLALSFFLSLFLTPLSVFADVSASIDGTVTNAKGAVVANAAASLTNTKTGYERTLASGADGECDFLSLPVGERYAVEIGSSGFQKLTKAGIMLQVTEGSGWTSRSRRAMSRRRFL